MVVVAVVTEEGEVGGAVVQHELEGRQEEKHLLVELLRQEGRVVEVAALPHPEQISDLRRRRLHHRQFLQRLLVTIVMIVSRLKTHTSHRA